MGKSTFPEKVNFSRGSQFFPRESNFPEEVNISRGSQIFPRKTIFPKGVNFSQGSQLFPQESTFLKSQQMNEKKNKTAVIDLTAAPKVKKQNCSHRPYGCAEGK